MTLERIQPSDWGSPELLHIEQVALAPDTRLLAGWLRSHQVLRPDGQVMSWHNPAHPGYPYPDATALWLSWAVWRMEMGLPSPNADAVRSASSWLLGQMATRGSIGRGQRRYLLDTCLAFHALVRAARRPGLLPVQQRDLTGLLRGIDAFLAADSPVLPAVRGTPRWSERWQGHLHRGASLVMLAGEWLDHPAAVRAATRILEHCQPIEQEPSTYLHALCYQVEGQLLLTALGAAPLAGQARSTARWLAELQREDGLMPGWADRPAKARCDTTAQAIRVWAAMDPSAFAEPIMKALTALATLQHARGSIPYEPRSADRNTWVSIFADQATTWVDRGADPLALI